MKPKDTPEWKRPPFPWLAVVILALLIMGCLTIGVFFRLIDSESWR